jgi:hypothetical protein
MSARRTCMATQEPTPCCVLALRDAAAAAAAEEEEEEKAVSGEVAAASVSGEAAAAEEAEATEASIWPTTSARSSRISRLGRKRKAESCARYLVSEGSQSTVLRRAVVSRPGSALVRCQA